MSQSILKRCLELVEEDLPTSSSSKHAKPNLNKSQKKSTIFDLIPEQKRLTITTKGGKNQTKRKIKKISPFYRYNYPQYFLLETQFHDENPFMPTEKVNKIKTTEKFTVKQAKDKMKRSKDRTEENVKRLLALDNALKIDEETKELMLRRARTGHYVVPEKQVKEEEDVFTEEDFAKFEREYFFKS